MVASYSTRCCYGHLGYGSTACLGSQYTSWLYCLLAPLVLAPSVLLCLWVFNPIILHSLISLVDEWAVGHCRPRVLIQISRSATAYGYWKNNSSEHSIHWDISFIATYHSLQHIIHWDIIHRDISFIGTYHSSGHIIHQDLVELVLYIFWDMVSLIIVLHLHNNVLFRPNRCSAVNLHHSLLFYVFVSLLPPHSCTAASGINILCQRPGIICGTIGAGGGESNKTYWTW